MAALPCLSARYLACGSWVAGVDGHSVGAYGLQVQRPSHASAANRHGLEERIPHEHVLLLEPANALTHHRGIIDTSGADFTKEISSLVSLIHILTQH